MKNTADCTSIGSLVRHERKRQGLTQEQLAGIAGVGIRFVRELETGKTTCQLGLALQVMRTLGLSWQINNRDGSLT